MRAAVGVATGVIVADPALWLLGALSFSVRGGVLLVLLPVLWVPSPVLLSVFLGRYITTSGLSPDVVPVAFSVVVGIAVAVVAAVLLGAYAQLASFERVVSDDRTADLRGGHLPRALPNGERRGLILRLTAIQVVALVPALALLPIVGQRIGAASVAELQFPSSLDTPFVVNVLLRVQAELLVLVALVLLADLLASLASQELLAARFRVLPDGLVTDPVAEAAGTAPLPATHHPDLRAAASGLTRLVRQPLRSISLDLLVWLITIGALAVTIGGTVLGWDTVRAIFFRDATSAPMDGEIAFIGQLVALVIFGAIWVAGITLAGIASSLRGALWATNTLR